MFEVKTGVRQGCALSLTLFNYAIDYILNRALWDYAGVEVDRNVRVSDLAYADDIVLVRSNCDDVQAALNHVQAAAWGVGMTINASKTKVMSSQVDPINWQPLTLDGVNLEDVQFFCLSRLNDNAVKARCCWGGAPYRSCKVHIRASQAVNMGTTRYPWLRKGASIKPLFGRSSSVAAKHCSTTIAFVTFYDAAESIVCPQLLYVVALTSVLFHPSCSSVVSDGSGKQLDAQRERAHLWCTSPHFSS